MSGVASQAMAVLHLVGSLIGTATTVVACVDIAIMARSSASVSKYIRTMMWLYAAMPLMIVNAVAMCGIAMKAAVDGTPSPGYGSLFAIALSVAALGLRQEARRLSNRDQSQSGMTGLSSGEIRADAEERPLSTFTQTWVCGKREPSVPIGYIGEQWHTTGKDKSRNVERVPSGDLRWSDDGFELYAGDRVICPAPWRKEIRARVRLRDHIRILETRTSCALYITADSTESYKRSCRESAAAAVAELRIATAMLSALVEHPKNTYHALEQDRLADLILGTGVRGIDTLIKRLAAGGFPARNIGQS